MSESNREALSEERVREIAATTARKLWQREIDDMSEKLDRLGKGTSELFSAHDARLSALERGRIAAPYGKIPAHALESRPAAPTSKADESLREVVEALAEVERQRNRSASTDLRLAEQRFTAALTAARGHVEKNKAGVDARESSSGKAGSMDVPIKPCSTTAADAPQDGASASIPAPSSLEVVCECGHKASQHPHVDVASGTQSGKRSYDGPWMCLADFCRCTRTRAEVEGLAALLFDGPEALRPKSPPPTTGERDIPSWVPSVHDLRCARDDARYFMDIETSTSSAHEEEVAGLRRIRRLIAQRAPLSPEAKGEGTVDVEALRAQKDAAYAERDRLVCALSKVFPSWLARHPDSDKSWDDDWRWIVFVQLPTGQSSWHIKYDELTWFDHLERRASNDWDGHTTEEKYARLARLTGGAK